MLGIDGSDVALNSVTGVSQTGTTA
jgi:hypothetical protein